MESKPVLWDKNSEALQPLRQPNRLPSFLETQEGNRSQLVTDTESRVISDNRKSTTETETPKNRLSNSKPELAVTEEIRLEDIVSKSTLRAEAPEWKPPSCNSSISNIQKRLKVHKKSQEADYVQNLNMTEKTYSSGLPVQDDDSDEDSVDIIRLKQIINTLTKDPGQFDNLLDLFMETIFPYFEDIMALSVIAQLLVEQAINNSNFRYTGARLCWYVEQNCPKFRAELHLKCKKQLEDNVNKQNVLLFIAELYTQLPHLNVYGALLIESFKQLLSRGGNDNVKCICQALKLTGYSLEQSNKTDLDEVFTQLNSISSTLNASISALVNSVINLRNSNWGYSNEAANNADSTSDEFYFGEIQNTVFYNADGQPFTNEEKEFLAAHMDSNAEYLSDNSDPDDLCDPEPEMDEEIQVAFREFVKFSKH